MRRILVPAFCCALLVLSGCGSSTDSLVKQQIDLMNDFAEAIESGASDEEIQKIQDKAAKIAEQLDALDLTEDEKQEYLKKHEEAAKKAALRLQNAMMKKMQSEMGGKFPDLPGMGKGAPQ